MSLLKKILKLENISAIFRSLLFKAKYRNRVDFPIGRVFFGKGTTLNITGNGRLIINAGSGDNRVYFSKNCCITISNGTISIGPGVFFNENCRITSHASVRIGRDCLFGYNVNIFDSDHKFTDKTQKIRYQGYEKSPVEIGENCWVGTNAVITKGSNVADSSVVAANCVFNLRSAREGGVYGGIPAKLIKLRQGFD